MEEETLLQKDSSPTKHFNAKETLIYFVWRCCFSFFETVEDGRVHSCFKKRSRLAKRNNCAFPGSSLINAFQKT
ncbi:hypothetical protein KL86DES1_20933 [uncultured Desulfovibrio sp.]|uniref:Uncharacterized protein n=1 Tax=uncultured Desulfovibrio sp. TaxID=167968 RepID=A0A212L5T6_9BACT|nr:hypothetical protein KL86DES1_20933 [uncultured Desulfovibrio sp.]VZH33836.1 conserved protein of unknown function [Desulfovibrio sp. 86]